jgi:hypothetical protein
VAIAMEFNVHRKRWVSREDSVAVLNGPATAGTGSGWCGGRKANGALAWFIATSLLIGAMGLTTAYAADAPSMPVLPLPAGFTSWLLAPFDSPPAPLTSHGVTLYGTFDVGVLYQTHGVPVGQKFAPGAEYVVLKNSNKPILQLAPNGLGGSAIGVNGTEYFADKWAAVFAFEAGFRPAHHALGQ